MAISSRVRRVKPSCPKSGGGFKANATAPRLVGRRRNEAKPNETNAKPAISFRRRKTSFGALGETGDFAERIQLLSQRFVSLGD